MWNQIVPQRALLPFALIGIVLITLPLSIPVLRTPLASTLVAVTVLLLLIQPVEREIRSSSQFRTRILLVGNNRRISEKFLEEIEAQPKRGYSIVGIVEEAGSSPAQFSPYLVLGTTDQLRSIVQAVRPNRIVLALSDRRGRMPATELLEFQSDGVVVEDVVDACERFTGKAAIETVTSGQLIASQQLWKPRILKRTQRALSFAVAAILTVLLAPLLGMIALAIALDSGCPIFFTQTRLGKGCRPFQLIKFRTMQPAEFPTSQWVQDNLSRITRLGKWLRRLRLDELPQLVNVLRGDMNIVGPRPHPVCNLELFRDAIPYYVLRGSILPGITGWAQTRYHYANNLEQETEKMRYDLYYIKHMSLWMDLRIIMDTARVFISSFSSQNGEAMSVAHPIRTRALLTVASELRYPAETQPLLPVRQADEIKNNTAELMEPVRPS